MEASSSANSSASLVASSRVPCSGMAYTNTVYSSPTTMESESKLAFSSRVSMLIMVSPLVSRIST